MKYNEINNIYYSNKPLSFNAQRYSIFTRKTEVFDDMLEYKIFAIKKQVSH
jgi:hypothetical protein